MRTSHEITQDHSRNDELWNMALPHRIDTIPKDECRAGFLYWGDGSGVADIAICTNSGSYGDVYFRGIRETRGMYDLFTERHPSDTGEASIGWAPIVMLEEVPELLDEKATVLWLLEKEVEVVKIKIDWLRSLPDQYKQATEYSYILDTDRKHLKSIQDLSRIDLTSAPMQPYDEMNQERKRRGLPQI